KYHVSHINFLLLSKYTKYLPIIQRKYEKYRNNYFALLNCPFLLLQKWVVVALPPIFVKAKRGG
ncbi:MAG: hypothetical protein SNI87_08165, partial [Rikenellaceae bacterium]